jgi:hypothetical protein
MSVASVEGTVSIRARPSAFVGAFVRRVEEGLFPGSARRRVDYVVTRQGADGLGFRARSWWTAIAVGLNDVDLAVSSEGRVRYVVRYARWAAYVVAMGGVLGAVLIALFLLLDIRAYILRHPEYVFSALSTDQNVAMAWGMALFWAFAWPWLLVVLYRRPLRRLIERIIAEVDVASTCV